MSDLITVDAVSTEKDVKIFSEVELKEVIKEQEEDKGYGQFIKTDYDREPLADLKVAADEYDISPEERKRRVKKLAGAISHSLRTSGEINVRCFGSKSIAKGAKALAIAKGYLKDTHKDLYLSFAPAFIQTTIDNNELTGISFNTFTSPPPYTEVKIEDVKSQLFVKADPDDINVEDRRISVRKLAGAITHSVSENKECVLRCFGSKAISKAAKALAISRGFVATSGADLYCWSTFIMADMNHNERTGIAYFCFTNS